MSAMSARRSHASSSSNAIGSSETLPLVITSVSPASASSRWWSGEYGSMTPSSGAPGATDGATGASGRLRASTTGRARPSRSSSSAAPMITSSCAAARSGGMSAKGLSSRCLRARSSDTAASSSARQARWKPPIPLIATMAPSASARAVASTASIAPGSSTTPPPA